MADNKKFISKLKLGDKTYNFKDAESQSKIGDVSTLKTQSKGNLVGAVNEILDKKGAETKYIDKADYKSYIGITSEHVDYNKIIFINDGSGIITRGQLYINNPYWFKVVDTLPTEREDNTLYLVKE